MNTLQRKVFFCIVSVFMLSISPSFAFAESKSPSTIQPPVDQRNKYQTDLFTGSASNSYPIQLPKGTNGLTPDVTLEYNSMGSRDTSQRAGAGWQLNQDYIERDDNFTPDDTNDDKYKLSFKGTMYDLVYLSSDDTFHTKVETHLLIKEIATSSNDKGAYWQITTPDGTKYRLGYLTNSELVCSNRSNVSRWNLDLVTDVHDNNIYYYYVEDSNVARLSRIEYNTDKGRAVEFNYGSNPYERPLYSHGCIIDESQRLNNITVIAESAPVHMYDLSYTTASNGQQLLSSITEEGTATASALPATTFTYNPQVGSWQTAWNRWLQDPDLSNASLDDPDTRLVDVNGDGLADIVKSLHSGTSDTYKVFKNTGSSWNTSGEIWVNNVAIDAPLSQSNVRLIDVNGDGLPDIVKTTNSGTYCNWYVYKNTGTSWNTTPELWINNSPVDARLDLTNVTMADVTGDGLPEIVKAYPNGANDTWMIYKNTGTSWSTTGETWIDAPIDARPDKAYTRLIDVNGDGLADIVKSTHSGSHSTWYVYHNTGSSWNSTPQTWINNVDNDAWLERTDLELSDVNGDGLPDIVQTHAGTSSCQHNWKVLLNKGNSWSSTFDYWHDNVSSCAALDQADTRIIDVNGDGLPDIVRTRSDHYSDGSRDNWEIMFNNGYAPNLLSSIKTSLGATISFEYQPSSKFDNTGSDSLSDLPFVMWLVTKMTVNNGLSNSQGTSDITTYSYRGGVYKWQDREFRGFGEVNETLPNTLLKKPLFRQDDGRTGMMYDVRTTDTSGNPYSETEYLWDTALSDGIYTTTLTSQKDYTYDGTYTDPKVKQVDFTYDSYGNILKQSEIGNNAASGDERYIYNEYTYDTTDYIVDKVKRTYKNASNDSTKVSESTFYYDGHSGLSDAPSKGDLTKQVDWLNGGTSPEITYTYDSHGNKITVTDANDNTTEYSYGTNDWTNTYPDSVTNAKGQTTFTNYDLGTGNLLSTTDPNGNTTAYTYDSFGRRTKEIAPYDSGSNPTTLYTYYNDGTAPEGVLVSKREIASPSATLNTYTWTDGLGRTIQTRTEAESTSQQIVVDSFYDPTGQVNKVTVPHFDTVSSSYETPLTNIRNTTTSYDGIGRPSIITNPKGDYKTIAYDHWKKTTVDENGHIKREFTNAFDKINKIEEVNNASTYTTTYEYDSRDLLTKITNNTSNDITFSYDSLGRKISQTDPDMGTWTYEYDAGGNVVSQTDNKNITITKDYDELNRITKVDYPTNTDITFAYDLGKIGTLSIATDSAGTVTYSYDNRLRKTQEQRTINGTTKTTQFSFDSMDRMATQTNPDGETVSYAYNPQGEVNAVSGSSSILSNIDYNALGKVTQKDFANGLTTNYTYSTTDFHLNRIQTGSLQDLNYTYDNVGNVKTITDSVASKTQTFGYDDLDRLTAASESAGFNNAYEYDSIGNLTKAINSGNSIDYTYGANSKTHALTSSNETILPSTTPEPSPSIFSLTDDWASGSINSAKWDNWSGAQASVVSQELKLNSTTASGYYGVDSGTNGKIYDLHGASIVNKLVSAGNQSITSWEVYPIYAYDATDSTNQYYWLLSGNTINAYKKVAGTDTLLASDTYNSTNHKWFRIRQANKTVYFDTSADGQTWTNFASTPEAFDASALVIGSEIGTWQAEVSTTNAIFDNFSISTPHTAVFADDWSSGSINDAKWNNWDSSHDSVSSSRINISTVLAGGYFGLDSGVGSKVYDLTNSSVQNQLVDAGNLSLNSLEVYPVSITKDSDSAYALNFFVAGSTLYAAYSTPGGSTNVKTAAYNSTTQKYFRIRETSGKIYWDTSADGATWNNYTSVNKPFDITAVRVGMMVGTWQSESSTTTAIFDNFNVISKPTSSVADGWSSGSFDPTKWENWGNSHVAVSSGQVSMTSTTASGYYGFDSGVDGNIYNLTGSSITNKLVDAGNQSITSWEVYPIYAYDANDSTKSYFWLVSGNTIKAYKQVSGTYTQLASASYNTTNHKWFRIRESGGTTYFDTSADGSTWSNFTSTANAFAVTSLIVGAEIGTWQTEASTTTAIFDNFNAFTPVYTYDANGNMTSDGTTCYSFNEANQLDKVTKCSNNETIAEYVYDYNGNRMVKRNFSNGALANTVTSWSDSFETKVIVGGATENTTYYWVNGELVAKKNPDGSRYYYHNDHLGSASVMTDATGALVESTKYDPWGEVLAGGTKSKFQYTGQEKDGETGLNYYNARYYNSDIRRFTQPDHILEDVYDPQMLNRYAYVRNNPLRYTDPSGHFLFAIPLAYWVVGAAVTAISTYLATPQGQTTIKSAINTTVSIAKNIASTVSNAVKSTTTYLSSGKSSAPPSTNSGSNNGSGGSPQRPNGGGIISGAVGAANTLGQQAQMHGNDLRNTATTWGYTLRDKAGEIVKFGQSINLESRYSQKWLNENELRLVEETSGSKLDMRIWEHEQIGNYLWEYGNSPALNDVSRSVNVFR